MKHKLLAALGLIVFAACEASPAGDNQSPTDNQNPATNENPPNEAGPYDQAIETLATQLEKLYVFPAVGVQYAAMLRENLAKGAYQGIDGSAEIAKRLTDDLQAVAPDKHLRVMPETDAGDTGAASTDGGAPPKAIGEAKWIADGVGYILFNFFSGDSETVAAVDGFMKEHASAKAIIIDARTHRGGSMRVVDTLLSYLFAQETLLVYLDLAAGVVQEQGKPQNEPPTFRAIEGPAGVYRREHVAIPNATEQRLFGSKIFYLTSSRTASAAEHLALALKRTGRGTLVGARTAGANHFGGVVRLGAGLAFFLPQGRTVDPDTGEDWEGVGIEPNVAVPAENALNEALNRIQ